MKIILSICLVILMLPNSLCFAQDTTLSTKKGRPKLVVMIAVDGLGADIFERYKSLYTGGFRRLINTGMNFTQTSVNHAFTISHPGHVTLSTGMNPSHHGIVDAAFYKRDGQDWKYVDAVRDYSEHIVGVPDAPGVSPKQILVSSLPEWIMEDDPQSRFAAIGSGQYSSLLHAGHLRGDVYWFDVGAGRYVTSSYYRNDYPDWVERFNREELPRFIESSAIWENTVPQYARKLARRDDASYEGFGGHTTFPHIFKKESSHAKDSKVYAGWFKSLPMADDATLALAKEAINARQLGQRNSVDYLSIVVSQVDDIGHGFGAGSQEQLDNLLRLDRELGDFFTYLDKKVGKNNYLIALSADHGMMDIPESIQETGKFARRLTEEEIKAVLKAVQTAPVNPGDNRDEIADKISKIIKNYDFVADVMTYQQLLGNETSKDPFISYFKNSFNPDRVPRYPLFDFSDGSSPIGKAGLVVRLKRNVMIDLDRAVHGSVYEYDRNVPLIFMGYGIKAGSSSKTVHTIDVAPTLAQLAGIKFPKNLDGHPLLMKTLK